MDFDSLTEADYRSLEARWISREYADGAGLYRVDSQEGASLLGRNGNGNYEGIVISNIWPGTDRPRQFRVRRDRPDYERKSDGSLRSKGKYLSGTGSHNVMYFPPGTDPAWLHDTSIPAVANEAEFKTLATWRYHSERGEKRLVFGFYGVWGWRGTVEQTNNENGQRVPVKGPISDLDRIEWPGRRVYIIFDRNVIDNLEVARARTGLAGELRRRGATVYFVDLPSDFQGNGVDDFLAERGPNSLTELLIHVEAAAATSSEPETSSSHLFSDPGNAEYFTEKFGQRLRYDHRRGRWLLWKGHRWEPDSDAEIFRIAIGSARARLRDTTTIVDADRRKKAVQLAIASESRSRIEAMLRFAKTMLPIADSGDNWDTDPWLLGTPTGVIDLRTGAIRPGRPEDRLTMSTRVSCDFGATPERWLTFLDEIFDGNESLINDFVYPGVGYSLSGDTSQQCWFLCHGTGCNGKSTFLGVLQSILGDFAMNMPFSTVELHQRSIIPNDLAALVGRRFIISSEINDGTRLNEARVKALTGCDPITARFLHSEFFTFSPVGKFWFAVNHKPLVRDDSHAFWRRVRIIPFLKTFDPDPTLPKKLLNEAPAILAWAVRGCLAWQKKGSLETPDAVKSATAEYQTDSDALSDFLAAACIQKVELHERASTLFNHYREWATREGLSDRERLSSTAFGRKMSQRFNKTRESGGISYQGVGIK